MRKTLTTSLAATAALALIVAGTIFMMKWRT